MDAPPAGHDEREGISEKPYNTSLLVSFSNHVALSLW